MTVTCPLEEVDRRLADAKRLWCKASDCYFDPDDFRIYAQNCIQTLRTITFVLQAQKARIPNFDEWYAVHQDTMRNDTVLRWLVDARNRIEKRGDLRRRSVIRASLITWHLDEFEPFDFDAKLFDGLQTIFHRIPLWLLKKYVLVHGVLRIERRWVHDCLPGHEVLEALAHVFEKLQDLVAECHRQIGVEPDDEEHVKLLDGRPPEMAGREEDRTMYINLSDGSMMETDHEELDFAPTEKDEREFVERFGKPPATADFSNLSSLADFYFEYARRIFLDIGYLSTQAIIFGKNGPVIFDMASSSRQEKLVNHGSLLSKSTNTGPIASSSSARPGPPRYTVSISMCRQAKRPISTRLLCLRPSMTWGDNLTGRGDTAGWRSCFSGANPEIAR